MRFPSSRGDHQSSVVHQFPSNRYRSTAGLLVALFAALVMVGCTRNEPPSVFAGSALTVDAGERATLSGEASDPDGLVAAYRWEQVAGEPVSIPNMNSRTAQFVAPLVQTATVLTFRLTATDDGGATANGEVAVTVEPYGSLSVAVIGTVRSHAIHAPISDASVTFGQYSNGTPHLVGEAVTGLDGTFAVEVPAVPGRLIVNVDAEGFASQSKIVTLLDATASRLVHLDMVPVRASQSFVVAEGADIRVDGHSVVSLPANAVLTATGEAHIGQAVASVAVLDPSKNPTVMPGDFLEWDADADSSTPIESYGAIDVRLAAADGARLKLGRSSTAQVSIPLASGRRPADAPPEMPLYYWSAELGYWVEEGQARLVETPSGYWAYVGGVAHFTTWNADVAYPSVWVSGCVVNDNGESVGHAEVTARGIDYTGTSTTTADSEGRFEIRVRLDSEVELVAASRSESSEAMTINTDEEDSSLEECLELLGESGLTDFPIQIEGESGTVEICVRDHECEDGDAVSVAVEGRALFAGEIVNEPACSTLEVEAGRDYAIELTALNGTGFKGSCNFADANTGEIRVSGLNAESQVWRHREGTGSRARILVTTGVTQSFTIVSTPPDASVRFVAGTDLDYQPNMDLVAGEYWIEVNAPGYHPQEVAIAHEAERPTRFEVKLQRRFEPGEVFTDTLASGGVGPVMVVVPPGSFRMGCLSNDDDCARHEKPAHTVTIPYAFAVSKHEVTFEAWDRCTATGGCGGYRPDDEGWGRGHRPVINVSWDDAQDYLVWLSAQTDADYRFLSEAEWEYAARAGSSSKWHFGDDAFALCRYANHLDQSRDVSGWESRARLKNTCSDGYDEGTAPVGSFLPNRFGLYDMYGNASEWVQDCAYRNYSNAPYDGSAWIAEYCTSRVQRGGSWDAYFRLLRSAHRDSLEASFRIIGFRVARTLIP